MTLAVRNSAGALKDAAHVLVRDAGALLQDVAEVWLRTPSGLKLVWGTFAVSLSALGRSAGYNSASAVSVTTQPVTVTASGAVGEVTYAWTQVSGDAGWTITDPADASTGFSHVVGPLESAIGGFHCTVSDAAGHSAVSGTVAASVRNLYFGGTA